MKSKKQIKELDKWIKISHNEYFVKLSSKLEQEWKKNIRDEIEFYVYRDEKTNKGLKTIPLNEKDAKRLSVLTNFFDENNKYFRWKLRDIESFYVKVQIFIYQQYSYPALKTMQQFLIMENIKKQY